MTARVQALEEVLDRLYQKAPVLPLTDNDRLVILSDLHMGNGGGNDDFRKNSAVTLDALENYYLPRKFTLILNGDIEEYLRAKPEDIRRAWQPLFKILEAFQKDGRLHRLVGNHEITGGIEPFLEREKPFEGESLRLEYNGNSLFVFHGHQAGTFNSGKHNSLIGFLLRLFANPLRIGSGSVAQDSVKKIKLEKTVYNFSRARGILSVIGHTHRPLFESLSKQESYNFHIEKLCRQYARAGEHRRERIRATVLRYKNDYHLEPKEKEMHLSDSVYGDILVPCLFNSGCGVGKRGITALEIKKGRIFLVFWSDLIRTKRYQEYNEYKPAALVGDAYRFILRRESLDYIFSRISLLK